LIKSKEKEELRIAILQLIYNSIQYQVSFVVHLYHHSFDINVNVSIQPGLAEMFVTPRNEIEEEGNSTINDVDPIKSKSCIDIILSIVFEKKGELYIEKE